MVVEVLTYVVTGLLLSVALVMLLRPQWVVRFQARFYRTTYKDLWQLGDTEINKGWQTPWDRRLMGSRTEFINRGLEHPEEFQGLMAVYRALGCVMTGLIALGLLGILFSRLIEVSP